MSVGLLKTSWGKGRLGNYGMTHFHIYQHHVVRDEQLCGSSVFKCVNYLEIGYGVWGGEPGGAGVLLVAKGPVEGLRDGAQIEGTDGRS